jgi:hypothetical protein
MAARRILKLAVLILLLVWEPGASTRPAPRRAPEGGGAWLDVGFRIDPEHPWTSWRFYVDFHPSGSAEEVEPEERSAEEPARAVEVGPASLARAAGGASYLLLRGGLETLRRRDRDGVSR